MLLILQSIIVYGFMIWAMTYNANRILKRGVVPQNFKQFITNKNLIIPILIFSFIASIRWGVGVDCNNYMANFYGWGIDDNSADKGEWGFVYLREFFRSLNLSHVPFFFSLALLEIGFLYYGLKNKPWMLLFFPLMLVLSGTYWSWMNGVRQSIVCCMFVYITFLVIEKKWLYAIGWIFLASFMHRSALVLLPLSLLCLYPKILLPNKWWQLGMVLISFLAMGMSVTDSLAGVVDNVLSLLGYEDGSQSRLIESMIEKTFGIRSFMLLFANCIAIYFSIKMRDFYESTHFNVMYNFYFIGVCAALVFRGNLGIERFLMYFTCFTPIILSCCAYYLYKHRNKKMNILCLCCLIGALTVRTMYEFYVASGEEMEYTLYKTIFTNKIPSGTYFL